MLNRTKEVNKRLKLHYGCNVFGEQLFRVVLSETQKEKRIGKFADWYGKIFIREWHGINEVPKYGYLKDKLVLERWASPLFVHDPLIPETSQGSYEPVYVFQDAKGNSLPLNEEFMRHIIYTLFHPAMPGDRASKLRTEEETFRKKEHEEFVDILSNESPYIASKLHGDKYGKAEAVVVPANYKG